ncbi:hypothetical protein B9Z55_028905 [Caenorhabditis nigoni]|uniref:Uncharacterized protein n=1 Tax=Caenorhabditis nigoni TaxID=1611254 RepID=A0A2G5S9W6_9PELO|nr:hypothetical protein B9Z55_028905 [Caenorhabditis nigoni]
MIQQLLDKLANSTSSGNIYSNPPAASSGRDYNNPANYSLVSNYSNPRQPVAYSTQDATSSSNHSNPGSGNSGSNYSNPGISKCEICRYELKSDDRIFKCFQCRCPSHTNCASNWLKNRQDVRRAMEHSSIPTEIDLISEILSILLFCSFFFNLLYPEDKIKKSSEN